MCLNTAQEMGLVMNRAVAWKPHIYHRLALQSSVMGHFCAVYCLTFDRTGLRFITGAAIQFFDTGCMYVCDTVQRMV